MLWKRVAVCGTPLAGKTTLLRTFAEGTGSPHFKTEFVPAQSTAQLAVRLGNWAIQLKAISGPFYPDAHALVQKLLRPADAILYISSNAAPIHTTDKLFFDLYVHEAQALSKFWTDVPWVFVWNRFSKSDSPRNPLLSYLPSTMHADIIPCVATDPPSTKPVWDAVVAAVANFPSSS